jgi:hypothetical protein
VKLTDTGPLVQARELLLFALAVYDAELSSMPDFDSDAWVAAGEAGRDSAEVALTAAVRRLDIWESYGAVWDDRSAYGEDDIADVVAMFEEAVEWLSEWLHTGRRPSVVAL